MNWTKRSKYFYLPQFNSGQTSYKPFLDLRYWHISNFLRFRGFHAFLRCLVITRVLWKKTSKIFGPFKYFWSPSLWGLMFFWFRHFDGIVKTPLNFFNTYMNQFLNSLELLDSGFRFSVFCSLLELRNRLQLRCSIFFQKISILVR